MEIHALSLQLIYYICCDEPELKGGQNITPQSFNNMVKVWTQEYASQTGHSITPGAYLIKSRYIPFNAIHNERFPTVIMLL